MSFGELSTETSVLTSLHASSHPGVSRRCDILTVYSPDAEEWCQYLQDLFQASRQVRTQKLLTHRLGPDASFSAEDLLLFLGARCVVVLLSAELVEHFYRPALLPLLQRALYPPHRVVRLLCGVQGAQDEFLPLFPDWADWQELTCEDEPEAYVAAVRKAISEGEVSSGGSRSQACRQGIFDVRPVPYYQPGGSSLVRARLVIVPGLEQLISGIG